MADERAVLALAEGPTAWNARRDGRGGRDGLRDLRHLTIRNAVLAHVDLTGVDLDGARLTRVDVRKAVLHGSRINGAVITDSDLADASLRRAQLIGADLDRVCLRRADFSETDSYELRVRRCDLTGASLRGARLRGAPHFYNCDLTGTALAGLQAPDGGVLKRCVVDDEQVRLLRQAGLRVDLPGQPLAEDWPQWEEFSVTAQDEDYGLLVHNGRAYWIGEDRYDLFLSHVSAYKDEIMRPLAQSLQSRGLRIWYDDERIPLAEDLTAVIDFGIRSSRLGVILVTPDFFGRRWTEHELEQLSRRQIVLLLHEITLDDVERLRPGLTQERLVLFWQRGLTAAADKLEQAVRQTPRMLA